MGFSYAPARVALPALPPQFASTAQAGADLALRCATTGALLGHATPVGPNEIDAFVSAARSAAAAWAQIARAERSRLTAAFAGALHERASDLAAAEAWNRGRPVTTVQRYDMARGIGAFEATQALRASGGVTALFVGNNAPLGDALALGASILAGGDAVLIVAPAAVALALLLAEREALHLPSGLLRVLPATAQATEALAAHVGIDRIVVRSRPTSATRIAAVSAPRTTVRVEAYALGATVVFEDAALDQAVDATVQTALLDRPWWCVGGTLVAVAGPLFAHLADRFRRRLETLRCGDPTDRNTDLAPASEHAAEVVQHYRGEAAAGGAEFFAQGNVVFATGLHPQHHLLRQHAPLATLTLLSFRTAEEATALFADCAPLGGASVWSDKGARALAVARSLRVALAACNATPAADGHNAPTPRRTFVA